MESHISFELSPFTMVTPLGSLTAVKAPLKSRFMDSLLFGVISKFDLNVSLLQKLLRAAVEVCVLYMKWYIIIMQTGLDCQPTNINTLKWPLINYGPKKPGLTRTILVLGLYCFR